MIFINNPSKFLENINNSQVAYFYTEIGESSLNIDNINTKLIPINLDNSVNLHEINIFNDYFSNISKINNNFMYWSSELSSKNRFTTNISQNFFKHYFLVKELSKIKDKNILILTNDFNIIKTIYMNFEKKFINSKNLFNSKIYIKEKIYFFLKSKKIFSELKLLINLILKSFISKIYLKKININEKYYIIKTHTYYNQINKLNNSDIFFGNLEKNFFNKNYFKLAHFQNDYFKTLKFISKNKYNIYPFEYFISTFQLLYLFIKKYFFKIKIYESFKNKINLDHIFTHEIQSSGISLNHLSFYMVAKNLSKIINIKKIYLTYENIAWENSFIFGLKKFMPNIKIIGYQHTVVPQASVGMFTSSLDNKVKPLPDLILTNGSVTKNIINQYSKYPIGLLDSSCALRFNSSYNNSNKRRKISNILVVLEGIPEVHKLVNYILNFSLNKNFNIIIRTHPVLPWKQIKNLLNISYTSHKIIISENNSLHHDFKRSDICIYWGSAVCLDAIKYGLPVVHFDEGNYLSYDPLFELTQFKWIINNIYDLEIIIKKINELNNSEFENIRKNAQYYVDKYLHSITQKDINKFLIK